MTTTNEKEEKASAKEARDKDMAEREKALNSGKTGVGLRTFLAMTRGKGNREIQYEAFDDSQPETLPKSIDEFAKVTETGKEEQLVSYLIEGFNSLAYTNASDPVAEYVDASWTAKAQTAFKLVVRNYSANAGVSIEDAVKLIKPGFAAAQEKAKEVEQPA